jgi:putative transcriptional regulator
MVKGYIAKVKPEFKSDAFEAIHSSASALFKIGAIDKATMRDFDVASFAKPPTYSADQIKKLREKLQVSQPVFAIFLNTSASTIEKWETGAKKPRGTALKLLDVVKKHGLEILA